MVPSSQSTLMPRGPQVAHPPSLAKNAFHAFLSLFPNRLVCVHRPQAASSSAVPGTQDLRQNKESPLSRTLLHSVRPAFFETSSHTSAADLAANAREGHAAAAMAIATQSAPTARGPHFVAGICWLLFRAWWRAWLRRPGSLGWREPAAARTPPAAAASTRPDRPALRRDQPPLSDRMTRPGRTPPCRCDAALWRLVPHLRGRAMPRRAWRARPPGIPW